ncbi:isoprenyl transferase [Gallicola sp. Sow4_E12]|uniref:isoprenyl transferase n=1 Tax=Gallicola sp. Sow4_E12 TaxID=3438785 RepID=UPI003F8E2AF3
MENAEIQKQIKNNSVPVHVGIIMDGNGRWAKKRHLPRISGHKVGAERIEDILEESVALGIQYLSLYAFSTENWKRPKEEVNSLMNLIVRYVNSRLSDFKKNNIKLLTMGDISKLPTSALNAVNYAKEETKDNNGLTLNIGLNYGGRDEIVSGIKALFKEYEKDPTIIKNLDSELFKSFLDTKDQPDVDLLIRPGGEKRISNFMLYQIAYSEFYFTECLWPDFTKEEFQKAILEFQNRERRYGGLK